MANHEIRRTRQMTPGGLSERVKEKEILKGKPTKTFQTGTKETKTDLVESFKTLLRRRPASKVEYNDGIKVEVEDEIKVFWPGRTGEFGIEKEVKGYLKKNVKGEEVIIEAPSAIEQIAMMSVRRGKPESISVKELKRWDWGRVGGELIVDVNKEVKPAFLKESCVIVSYSLADPDYWGVFLSEARVLDSRYADMSLREIGKDLRIKQKQRKK